MLAPSISWAFLNFLDHHPGFRQGPIDIVSLILVHVGLLLTVHPPPRWMRKTSQLSQAMESEKPNRKLLSFVKESRTKFLKLGRELWACQLALTVAMQCPQTVGAAGDDDSLRSVRHPAALPVVLQFSLATHSRQANVCKKTVAHQRYYIQLYLGPNLYHLGPGR